MYKEFMCMRNEDCTQQDGEGVCCGFIEAYLVDAAAKDGGEYGFLLKGHEDLRQDERVMQERRRASNPRRPCCF